MSRKTTQTQIVVIMLSLFTTTSANFTSADDGFRYAPTTRHATGHIIPLPQYPLSPATGSSEVIVNSLRGVMVVGEDSQLQVWLKPFDGLKIHAAARLTIAQEDSFLQAVQPYIGGTITQQRLNQMAQDMVRVYRNAGRPAVDVRIPAGQEVTEGMIQVVVSEATIGSVRIEGNCNFDDCSLLQYNWLRNGESIYVPCIENELRWLNRNPYRRVSASLQQSEYSNSADVVYHVCDETPIGYYVGFADNGPQTTGRERLSFGFEHANIFGNDHRLGYQYTTDAEFAGRFGVHSLSYQIPVPENRDTFNLYAEWGDVDTSFDDPMGVRSQSSGHFWQLSGRYQHVLCEENCRLDEMVIGFDFKGADNFADYGLFPAIYNGPEVHTLNLMAGVSSFQQFNDGYTKFGGDVFVSPGSLLPQNHARDFKQVRRKAKATYVYARGFLERVYVVNQASDLRVRITGQLGSGPLLPSEQLGFGGYNSVRGYDMRTLNGDSGYIMNLEYRTRPIGVCCNDNPATFTALVFSDIAQQANWNSGSTLPDDEFFASVGVGARFEVDPGCSFRFDYGVPLTSVRGDRRDKNGRLHLGAVLSF